MWKIFLGFAIHRTLIVIALLSFTVWNLSPWHRKTKSPNFPPTASALSSEIIRTLTQNAEYQSLKSLAMAPMEAYEKILKNPFQALAWGLAKLTHIPLLYSFLFLSNLFIMLSLIETEVLLTHTSNRNLAIQTCLLIIFLPTSYRLSFGSSLPALCFFVTWAFHSALFNKWVFCGFAFALSILQEPTTLILLPFLIFLFVYFQRHAPKGKAVLRFLIFVIPVMAVAYLKSDSLPELITQYYRSSIYQAYSIVSGSQGAPLIFEGVAAIQVLIATLFLLGSIFSIGEMQYFIYKLLPFFVLGYFLYQVPFFELLKQSHLGGLCLVGIASLCTTAAVRLLQATFLFWCFYDLYFLLS